MEWWWLQDRRESSMVLRIGWWVTMTGMSGWWHVDYTAWSPDRINVAIVSAQTIMMIGSQRETLHVFCDQDGDKLYRCRGNPNVPDPSHTHLPSPVPLCSCLLLLGNGNFWIMYLARSYYPLRIEECKMAIVLIFKVPKRERYEGRVVYKRDGITKSGGHGEMMKDERWDENDMNEKMRMMMIWLCVCACFGISFLCLSPRGVTVTTVTRGLASGCGTGSFNVTRGPCSMMR